MPMRSLPCFAEALSAVEGEVEFVGHSCPTPLTLPWGGAALERCIASLLHSVILSEQDHSLANDLRSRRTCLLFEAGRDDSGNSYPALRRAETRVQP
jgi:hypothetical protein